MSGADLRGVAVAAALLVAGSARAGGPGATSGQGMLLPASARPEGMGGAFVGAAEGPAALFWNPAGLANLEDPLVSVMHADYLGQVNYQVLSYGQPAGVMGGFAAAVSLLDYGTSPGVGTGPDGLPGGTTGALAATDVFATAGWGTALPRRWGLGLLRVGAAFKTAWQRQTESSAGGFGISGGLLWEFPGARVRFGLLADDLGIVPGRGTLPINWRAGAAWMLPLGAGWKALLVADARYALDTLFQTGAGLELSVHDLGALRLGWHGGGTAQTGPTFGAGINLPSRWARSLAMLRLDYAGEVAGDFGLLHRIELSAAFGDGVSRAARTARTIRNGMVDLAELNVLPVRGSGRAGEAMVLTGTGFPAGARLRLTLDGVPGSTVQAVAGADGILSRTALAMARPMPAGRYTVMVETDDGARPFVFKDAYEVRSWIALDARSGDAARFTLRGTGLPKSAIVRADTVRVGKMATRHAPIQVGADGTLPSTPIVVAGALPAGRYDLTVPLGPALTFASSYQVTPRAAAEMERQQGELKAAEAAETVAAVRSLEAARNAIDRLVKSSGERVSPRELAGMNDDVREAEADLQAGRYPGVEDHATRVLDQVAVVNRRLEGARLDEYVAYMNVLAAGFDTIQPPGAPAANPASASVTVGRSVLADAKVAIAEGRFDDAKLLVKASAELLRKAHVEAGTSASPEERAHRW